MFNFLFKNKIKCERCGSKDNVVEHKIFEIYPTRLCLKCLRALQHYALGNPDFKAISAIQRKYPNANEKEKMELYNLTENITRELYPILEKWLSHLN